MLRIAELLQATGLSRRTINRLLAAEVITAERDAANRLLFHPSVVTQLREMYMRGPVHFNFIKERLGAWVINLDPSSDSIRDGFAPFIFVTESLCVTCGHPFSRHQRAVFSHTHACSCCECERWNGRTVCIQC